MSDGVDVRHATIDPKRDLQQLECYRLNKFLLELVGQWPFSQIPHRIGFVILIILMGNFYVLEIAYILKSRTNIDLIIECFGPLMVHTVCGIKTTSLFIGAKTVKEIIIAMQHDWMTVVDAAELKIIREYADKSNFLTKTYIGWLYSTLVMYLLMPTIPILVDHLRSLNESRPKRLPSHLEYFFTDDPSEDYYWPVFFHQSLGSFSILTLITICYTTYFTLVEYICGVFASLCYKLEHLTDGEDEDEDMDAPSENNRVFAKIVECINHHRKAIQFAEMVEENYYMSNLFEIVMLIVALSICGVQTVLHLDETETALRFGSYCTGLLLHVFFTSLPGQALYDHSTSIFDAAYNCKWYGISKKSRYLLRFMMLRSLTPCQLTAGKFYVTDLKTFTSVVQTAMSYFTVLTSRS